MLARRDLHAVHLSAATFPFGAAGDPLTEDAVLPGVDIEPFAAAMRDLSRGLEQQQTLIRRYGIDSPAEAVAGEGKVVFLGRIAEQAEVKASFALEGTMARAG